MFQNRADAGRLLAALVTTRLGDPTHVGMAASAVVLGLPRGGVPVAAAVAEALGAPLDVLVVRKIGVPWQPELALGAVGENGAVVLNNSVIEASGVRQDEMEALVGEGSRGVEQVVAELRLAADPADLDG